MEKLKTKKGMKYRESIYINGRKKNSPSFSRKTDARKWKVEMEAKKNKGLLEEIGIVKKDIPLFKDYALQWLDTVKVYQLTPSTLQTYRAELRNHIFPMTKLLKLNEIQREHGEALLSKMIQNGHKPKGCNKVLGVFKSILLHAEDEELITKSPLRRVKKLKEIGKPPKFWSSMEINQFLRVNQNHEYYYLF